jgi:hypothetical protein
MLPLWMALTTLRSAQYALRLLETSNPICFGKCWEKSRRHSQNCCHKFVTGMSFFPKLKASLE